MIIVNLANMGKTVTWTVLTTATGVTSLECVCSVNKVILDYTAQKNQLQIL